MIKVNKKSKLQIILIVLIISSVALVPTIPKSYAHAFVVKSDPSPSESLSTAPTKVVVHCSDPLEIKYSAVKVLDADGKEVQLDDLQYVNNDQSTLSVSLPSGLKDGIYTVSTKMLDQTDGHVTEDAFVFAIGVAVPQNVEKPSTASNYQVVSVPEAIARFPALVGQVIVAGIVAATLWLWSPLSRIPRLREMISQTRIDIDSSMIKWAVIGCIILLASGFGMIIVQAYSINAGILDAIATKFGNMWTIRMILSSALFGLALTMYYKQKKNPKVISKGHLAILLGVSFSVLLTTSLISHGAATSKIVPFLLDFVHNVFSSLWIGGLFYFAFVAKPQLRKIADSNLSLSIISIIIPRFTTLVITILGAVVITGPFLLYALETNLALTLASVYGKILIIKLSLAAGMIALGGYDHVDIRRAAYAAISHRKEGNSPFSTQIIDAKPILSRFHTSARIAVILGIALIGTVAVLVDSGLPSSEFQNQLQVIQNKAFALTSGATPSTQFTQIGFLENGTRVVLSINPLHTGDNEINISFLDSQKNPIDIKSAQLKLTQTDRNIGPITIDANKTSTGMFTAKSSFGFAGHWSVRIEGVQNKENALNLVAGYNLFVNPDLNSLLTTIKEYKTPQNTTMPLYPLYDKNRNVAWTGDSAIKSGEILEFDLSTSNYTVHKLNGINIVTLLALDSHDTVWYIDPLTKTLGHFNPSDNSNKNYTIPSKGILSSIAIDANDTVWLTAASTEEVLKFEPNTAKFSSIKLADKSEPLGMSIDNNAGKIWIAEGGSGKIASLDISNNKVTEFAPTKENYTLVSPTGIISDPDTGKIFVSEHDGAAVSIYDPLLNSFKRIKLDPNGLPFGMAFDKYHNLWVAQHTIDKIAIVDPRTGEMVEKDIPTKSSFVQWITSDSQGNIIIAEQRGNALGTISISAGPAQSIQSQSNIPTIPTLSFSYADVVAPSITGLLIIVAFFYSKGVVDLRKGLHAARQIYE